MGNDVTDYIRRDTALFVLRKAERGGSMTALTRLERAYAEIREMPAADVAPVTRCKDCEHYDLGVCLKIYSDGSVHPAAWQSRKPTDFCSYGTPKNDGGET